jgi:hypothetical protein
VGSTDEFGQQAGLAYAGITGQQHHLRVALVGSVEYGLKPLKLPGPANERWIRQSVSHARQYGDGQQRWKRDGNLGGKLAMLWGQVADPSRAG